MTLGPSLAPTADASNVDAALCHIEPYPPRSARGGRAETPANSRGTRPAPAAINHDQRLPKTYLFPYFLPMYETNVIVMDASLEAKPLAVVLAALECRPGPLPLVGKGYGVPVTLLAACGSHQYESDHRDEVEGMLSQVLIDPLNTSESAMAWSKIRLEYQDGQRPIYLDQAHGRHRLMQRGLAGRVLMIYDIAQWLSSPTPTSEAIVEIVNWFARLTAEGGTVVIFERRTPDEEGLAPHVKGPMNRVELELDPAAPALAGGAFIISKPRISVFDEAPPKVRFWFDVNRGQFSYGLEIPTMATEHTQKELETLERMRKIAQWQLEGMEQKEMAECLRVSASTVSRLVAQMRQEQGR